MGSEGFACKCSNITVWSPTDVCRPGEISILDAESIHPACIWCRQITIIGVLSAHMSSIDHISRIPAMLSPSRGQQDKSLGKLKKIKHRSEPRAKGANWKCSSKALLEAVQSTPQKSKHSSSEKITEPEGRKTISVLHLLGYPTNRNSTPSFEE